MTARRPAGKRRTFHLWLRPDGYWGVPMPPHIDNATCKRMKCIRVVEILPRRKGRPKKQPRRVKP